MLIARMNPRNEAEAIERLDALRQDLQQSSADALKGLDGGEMSHIQDGLDPLEIVWNDDGEEQFD